MKTSFKVLVSLVLLAILILIVNRVPEWIWAVAFTLSGLAVYIVFFIVGSSVESKDSERRREMGIVETAKKLLEQAKEMNRYPMWPLHRKYFEGYFALGNLCLRQGNANDAIANLRLALIEGGWGMKPLEPLS